MDFLDVYVLGALFTSGVAWAIAGDRTQGIAARVVFTLLVCLAWPPFLGLVWANR